MKGRNIFITGTTGFIGKRLTSALAEENRVVALVKPKSEEKTKIFRKFGVKIIIGDLLDASSYSQELKEVDYVFHLAALFRLEAPKEELYKTNVIGTQKFLEACRRKNIKRIMHFSTAGVSGNYKNNCATEEAPYLKSFRNWYEWSKAEGEKLVLQFHRRYDLPITVIRPAIVYGPGSFYGFFTALDIIARGKLFIFPGNGANKIHLVHVDDVVGATIHLAEREGSVGKIYNICDDKVYNCEELVKMVCKELGVKPPQSHLHRFIVKGITRMPFEEVERVFEKIQNIS